MSMRVLYLLVWVSVSLAADVFKNAAPDVPYAGSTACAVCHADIYSSYKRSNMGRSMSVAGPDVAEKVTSPVEVAHPRWNRRFRVYRQDDTTFQSIAEPGPDGKDIFRASFPLQYAVGSGVNGWTYLVMRNGHLFEAPLSYYARVPRWDLSPGYESADAGFNRAILPSCLACHAGRPVPGWNDQGRYGEPPFAELAIGCENCHGPGSLHVTQNGRVATNEGLLIVNPARLPARLAENICMRCHQDGDARVLQPGTGYWDFRPGNWLIRTLAIFRVAPRAGDQAPASDLLEHHFAMQQSRCFEMSGNRLSCFTCHQIHKPPPVSERLSYYRSRCLSCHAVARCKLPTAERLRRNADSCIACHMPSRDVRTIAHSTLTQHRVSRPGVPAPTPEPQSGDPAGLILVNRPPGTAVGVISPLLLLQTYGRLLNRRPEFRPVYAELIEQTSRSSPDHPGVQAALGRRAPGAANARVNRIGHPAPDAFRRTGSDRSRDLL